MSILGQNWLILPQDRLNLHDFAVKRGGGGAGSAHTWICPCSVHFGFHVLWLNVYVVSPFHRFVF